MIDIIKAMISYAQRHGDLIIKYLGEHVLLLVITFIISYLVAAVIVSVTRRNTALKTILDVLTNGIFAIPTLAMFAILIPYTGLGIPTAVTTMVLYNQFSIVKNINRGFDGIDKSVIESANAMGLDERQRFIEIDLPLAMPVIVSGMKMTLIATLTMGTLAATIGAGGLGVLLFQGLRMKKWHQVGWGIVLTVLLGVIVNISMEKMEEYALKKSRGYRRR